MKFTDDIKDETTLVSRFGRKSPFKVPDGYFDRLHDDVMADIAESRLAARFGKDRPFDVPKGYFDGLHDDVMQRIGSAKAKPRAKRIYFRPLYIAAAAAVAVMLVVSYLVPYMNSTVGSDSAVHEQMLAFNDKDNYYFTDAEVEQIIEDSQMDDYSLYQLVSSVK